MELPTEPDHLFGPGSNLDDNMAEIELFVRYSRDPNNLALNDRLLSYYITVAKGYWADIQQIIFDPNLHHYIKGMSDSSIRHSYQSTLLKRRNERLKRYGLTGAQLDQEILALNPNPSDVNPNVQALAQSKYPLELNYGSTRFLGKPFDPRDIPLVFASEDERIQYLIDNLVNYGAHFNELIDEIRRFYYVEKKVNISRILNLFNYLAGVASVYLLIDERLSRLGDLKPLVNNNSGEVFVLVSEKDHHPGFNSWLYGIVEGINLITFPKFKSVHQSPNFYSK